MSSRTPPLHLRPCKFVDRMMFVDLMGRLVGDTGAQNYSYISMGATFLPDHHVVYRRIGISDLVSFGNSGDDIRRQYFNRPTDAMRCETMDSEDIPEAIDSLRGKGSLILWLDYMFAEDRRIQLQETERTLQKLMPGDLLKVTLNSDYRTFGDYGDYEKTHYADLEEMAAAKLSDQLKEYLPANLTKLSRSEFPRTLTMAVELAAEKSRTHRPEIRIVPTLATSYADGQRMVTVTCLVRSMKDTELPQSIRGWEHRSNDWSDIKNIEVPDLSLREKYYLDSRLNESSQTILTDLPFRPHDDDAAESLKRAIESYKLFHRYYPGFQHLDA